MPAFLIISKRFKFSEEEARQEFFLKNLLHSYERISRVFCQVLQKDPLRLDRTDHRSVTFLGIFPRRFTDRANVLLPHRRKILQPIMFGLFIHDKTANITRVSENIKPVTQAK